MFAIHISPPPVLPGQGGGVHTCLPWREGLRAGVKWNLPFGGIGPITY